MHIFDYVPDGILKKNEMKWNESIFLREHVNKYVVAINLSDGSQVSHMGPVRYRDKFLNDEWDDR